MKSKLFIAAVIWICIFMVRPDLIIAEVCVRNTGSSPVLIEWKPDGKQAGGWLQPGTFSCADDPGITQINLTNVNAAPNFFNPFRCAPGWVTALPAESNKCSKVKGQSGVCLPVIEFHSENANDCK